MDSFGGSVGAGKYVMGEYGKAGTSLPVVPLYAVDFSLLFFI